jgi:hypothetical protein
MDGAVAKKGIVDLDSPTYNTSHSILKFSPYPS